MNETTKLADIQRNLLDPKVISKQTDPTGRSELAHRLLQLRKQKRDLEAGKQSLLENSSTTEQELNISGMREDQLESDSIARLNTVVAKLKRLVGLKDKKALLIQEELARVSNDREKIISRLTDLSQEIDQQDRLIASTPDPKQELMKYYESKSNQPLSVEEKKKILTPELLASLSLEEYLKLWQRLNPQFLSHVTRQGFRDHAGMPMAHSKGMDSFTNGFEQVLHDSKQLQPPIAVEGLKNRDEKTVREQLSKWILTAENETEALRRLESWLNFSFASAPNYPDKTSVHFAAQCVADFYYGSETGNEIFFIFPTDAIASQNNYSFNGWEKDFTKPQSELKWNDVFVWPADENSGVSIDAGIVFIPNNAKVDKETGSKYASELGAEQTERAMVLDQELADKFHKWCIDDSSPSFQRVKMIVDEYRSTKDGWYGDKDYARQRAVMVIVEEFQQLSFTHEAAERLALEFFSRFSWDSKALEEPVIRDEILAQSKAMWKRPSEVVTAKEYWEEYFVNHPDLRPKHIIYYDGDPSSAVRDFQQRNGINTKQTADSQDKLLGLDDKHVSEIEKDPRAWRGYTELEEMSMKIISEHYLDREVTSDLSSSELNSPQ